MSCKKILSELGLEISVDEFKNIIKQALKNPSEAKFLLTIETWYRQGPAYTRYRSFKVIYGEVDEVLLERSCDSYPYDCYENYIIVPKSVPAIVLVEEEDETVDPPVSRKELYVFTKDGWKRVEIH
jgi:hypothetical protein